MTSNATVDSRLESYELGHEMPLEFSTVRAAVRHNGQRTPFLLVDLELVRAKIRRFRAAMPEVRIHYAMKANPHPEILRVMIEEGVAFEVASAGELEVLLALGVPGHEIHYNNPIKPPDHLERAAREGVAWYAIGRQGPHPARRTAHGRHDLRSQRRRLFDRLRDLVQRLSAPGHGGTPAPGDGAEHLSEGPRRLPRAS